MKIMQFVVFLPKSHILEKSLSLFLKSEQIELTDFCKLVEIYADKVVIFWVDMVKSGCNQSGYATLKLAVFQKRIDEIN